MRTCLLIVLALAVVVFLWIVAGNCTAAEEKVVNLPSDANKWYLSVVGEKDSAEYQALLSAFDSTNLKKLKGQVHFLPVTTDTAIYTERYQSHQGKYKIAGLPCVRVQTAAGVVVYQASKPDAGTLYQEISAAVEKEATRRYLLPWRQNHHVKPDDIPKSQPNSVTPPPPLEDDKDEPPDVESVSFPYWLIGLAALAIGVGIGVHSSAAKRRQASAK